MSDEKVSGQHRFTLIGIDLRNCSLWKNCSHPDKKKLPENRKIRVLESPEGTTEISLYHFLSAVLAALLLRVRFQPRAASDYTSFRLPYPGLESVVPPGPGLLPGLLCRSVMGASTAWRTASVCDGWCPSQIRYIVTTLFT